MPEDLPTPKKGIKEIEIEEKNNLKRAIGSENE